jgi:dolichol-phosphate mannosyltransferase
MTSNPLQLSIVVPTFNEASNVVELLRRVEAAMDEIRWELVFVDDDSPDGTARTIREIASVDTRVRCLRRVGRRGLASACIEGMLAASAPVIAVMDADLQHDETILPAMFTEIATGADVVVGTRYAPGGGTGDWQDSRKSMSRLATRVSHMVLKQPVSDPMSGFFMVRRDVLESSVHRLSGIGFKILLDILLSAPRTLHVAEVAYEFRNRKSGESKLDSTVIWEFGMLLADKTVGRIIPVRFLAFSLIGGLGVFVHMAILSVFLRAVELHFEVAQTVATVLTMVFNFALNNVLTYRDRRLAGLQWFGGLLSFMLACGIGAVANIGIATYLFNNNTAWVPAALAGILVGAVWNYAATAVYTWGKRQ